MTEQTINKETGEIMTTDSHTQAALFAKLARAMGKLARIPKHGRNQHFNYDFSTDGDVSDAVRPALAAEGVAFFASMTGVDTADKKTIAHFDYTFADGETGATWTCHWAGEAIDSQDKGLAKAATSGLKYFLLKTFMLSTGDPTDDGDADAPATKTSKPQKSSQPASAPTHDNGHDDADPQGAQEGSKRAFFNRVVLEIPYFTHTRHAVNALKQLGFTAYSKEREAEMFAALQKHASAKANEEAA